MVDPQRGISVPVISQFFVILGLLIFLALGGHLATLRLIADSFELLPLGQPLGDRRRLDASSAWGSQMFAGAVRIALPAATALLIANIAFGVMSRAAPTLNLFAVGLPAGLLIGFLILLLNIGHLSTLLARVPARRRSTMLAANARGLKRRTMAENDTPQHDRTEQPSTKRLDDARARGEVPRSRELAMTAVVLAGAAVLLGGSGYFAEGLRRRCSSSGSRCRARRCSTPSSMPRALLERSERSAFGCSLPLFVA